LLAEAVAVRTRILGRPAACFASLVLDYAYNVRRKLEAGILRSSTAPEGPHNTTEVISAKTVYHTFPFFGGVDQHNARAMAEFFYRPVPIFLIQQDLTQC
jgi:hypothetical protein